MIFDCHKVDELIFQTMRELDYQKFLTPINFTEENSRFLEQYNSGFCYNPKYKYNCFNPDTTCFAHEVLNVKIDQPELLNVSETILHKRLIEAQNEILMYSSIGQHDFSKYAVAVNGKPNLKYYDYALDVLRMDDDYHNPTQDCYTPQDMKQVLENRINEYGFLWDVIISESMAAKVSVEPDAKTIFINSKKTFNSRDVIRLIVHEIDTHVLRAENGLRRDYKVYTIGTSRSLLCEEGLAIYNELSNDVLDLKTLKIYAARFLCCIHIDKSFFELFDMLIKLGCSYEMALYVVSRIKRGLSDTALSGGYIKDYVYLQGFKEIEDVLTQDFSIKEKLYYGAIALDDLPLLNDDIVAALNNHSIILPKSSKIIN